MYTTLRIFVTAIIFALVFSNSLTAQSRFVRFGAETNLLLPPGWSAPSDTISYPFRISHDLDLAELILFKSQIAPGEAITNDFDLHGSVQNVIDDVILSLPDAKTLINSGYYDGERCGFVIEFLSTDSVSNVKLHHRLSGIIYRLFDGSQVLFTLWGKAPEIRFDKVKNDFLIIQDNFEYTGEHTTDVYQNTRRSNMYLYGLLAVMLGLLAYVRKSRKEVRVSTPVSDRGLWYCPCGTPNFKRSDVCHACGSTKAKFPVT